MAGAFESGDEPRRSEEQLRRVGPELAREAASVRREDPEVEIVGIVAEPGTLEARRCRTKLEQDTGIEFGPAGFAGVLAKGDLVEILDRRFPPRILTWLLAGAKGPELRYVICTQNGFRVAAIPIPEVGV